MTTYVLVDGENIDGVLGGILNRRPGPEDRPRWDKIIRFAKDWQHEDVIALFFINATNGDIPWPFIQALRNAEFRPILISGPDKVVDDAIMRTLLSLREREGNVLLLSHDSDFRMALEGLRQSEFGASRHVGVLGFIEHMSHEYGELEWVEKLDLEYDAQAFLGNVILPRMRVLSIDDFRPEDFLGAIDPTVPYSNQIYLINRNLSSPPVGQDDKHDSHDRIENTESNHISAENHSNSGIRENFNQGNHSTY
ncbi:MAG: nuclease [Firmicutes bacterium]|jgi:uncharacterized protein|nr:nuclease [Bacillota bacterium]